MCKHVRYGLKTSQTAVYWNIYCLTVLGLVRIFVLKLTRKQVIAGFLIAVCSLGLHAQNVQSNRLDTASAVELTGKTAVELVNLANSKAVISPVKSMSYVTAALEKSISNNDKRTQYTCYNTLGTLYFNSANYAAAVQYFQLAYDGFASLNDVKNKDYSSKYLNLAQKRLAQLRETEKFKTENKKVSSKKKSYSKEAELKYRAAQYSDGTQEKIDIFRELGDYYLEVKDTAQAQSYWNAAEANSYKASDQVLLTNSTVIGNTYNNSGNWAQNIRFQNEVLNEGKKRGSDKLVAQATQNLGFAYLEAQQSDKAIPFLKESIVAAEKEGNTVQKQKSVKQLAKAYENLGQYDKALDVIKAYINTLDSIQLLQEANSEANLALNEEFIKQESRIQKLIASQKLKEADIKRQRNILWGLAAALVLFGFLTYLLVRNIRQKQSANMQIKLQSLRTQMNPHFIFNSLNSVNNFISKNDERSANKYLADFSKLMRTVLQNSDRDFVTLETEMQTLKIYLDLEHFRFGEKFDYTISVASDIDTEQVQVPPMLIQPYIENAIWHGLRYKETKGKLDVKIFTENEKLYCTVSDNGIGREQSAALKTDHQKTYQSTGIKNTKERIELLNKLHGTKLNISILDLSENGKPSGTMAKISLPYIMQLEEV
jgi:two-component system LytT family sensor kinase